MNFSGIILGASVLVIIGIFHPIVIKAEYHLGKKCWWMFAVAGIALCIAALFVKRIVLSSVLGVAGFSCFWSILELFEQEKRVKKGWFPENPNRKKQPCRITQEGTRKRTVIIVLAAVFALALIAAVLVMYERTQVAMIVDDERAWDLRDASPQKKVIISEGGMVARYLTEDEDNYIGDIQDSVWIPKSRAMVETWYACDGKGVVFLNEVGTRQAYAAPDSLSGVVGELRFEYGCCAESYDVAGYMDGWFAIEMDGNVGYVREKDVYWDAIDTN